MNTLYPVEAAWRQFRNISGALDVLQEGLQERGSYQRLTKLSQLPAEVVLPTAAGSGLLPTLLLPAPPLIALLWWPA